MEKKRNSTTKMRLTCAIIFIVFTYLYLSCYQQDLLAVAQHALSGGMTQYNYVLFPILTTLVLFLLQCGVFCHHAGEETISCIDVFSIFADTRYHHGYSYGY